MEPVLIVSGRDLAGRVAISDFDFDLEFGDGAKDDYELTCAEDVSIGEYVGIEGTEYGGVVDTIGESTKSAEMVYGGRSWHGILAAKVLCPDAGADYLTVSGDANEVLSSLVARVGLSSLVAVDKGGSGIYVSSYSFERYVDCYTGMREMLAKSGAKLMMEYGQGAVRMWAQAVDTIDGTVDSDVMDFDATTVGRQVNHLIGLGKGELRDRAVVHRYADASGNVSSTQTYTGVDEYAAVYDYSSAEADKLAEETEKKLKDLHTSGKVEFSIEYAGTAHVGDVITARNNRTGRTVTAPIAKKVVKVSGGVLTVQYDVGEQSTTSTSLSGSGETASSGTVYTAGDGISIESGRISAEVTQEELDAVAETARQGVDDASAASVAAGAAQAKADLAAKAFSDYETSNDAAVAAVRATADAAVSSVSATSPLSASRSGNAVALSHAASGVAAGAYGPTADASPTWGESVTVGARFFVDRYGHITSAEGRKVRLPSSTASSSAAGLMAASDKAKLDGIDAGAQANAVSSVNGKVGAVKLDASDVGAASASHTHDASQVSRIAASVSARGHGTMTHPVHRIATVSTTAPHSDFSALLLMTEQFDGGRFALVKVNARTNDIGHSTSISATVICCTDDFLLATVRVAKVGKSGDAHFDVFCVVDNVWSRLRVQDLTYWDDANVFTLVNSEENNGNGVYTECWPTLDDAATALRGNQYDEVKIATAYGWVKFAQKLQIARTINLTGAVKGSAKFDGSGDVTITTTGDSESAGFLAAYPVGAYFMTSDSAFDPSTRGGTWERVYSIGGPITWHRTA